MFDHILQQLSPERPVLIAGPTASGKSALALEIAERQGGVIINADASQVYDCWDIITACPSLDDHTRAAHVMYQYVAYDQTYSTGHWLRDATKAIGCDARPIFVGGTGLNFAALTEGLSDIPATPADLRANADARPLDTLCAELDAATRDRIDTANRARVQRAWEVLQNTGRGLAAWQDDPIDVVLPLTQVDAFVFDAPKDWLNPRIEQRFDQMIDKGAVDEVAAMQPRLDPALPACRAIGVPEIAAYLQGDITLDDAKERTVIATRQYAKRQRTWFRKRCANWHWLDATQ